MMHTYELVSCEIRFQAVVITAGNEILYKFNAHIEDNERQKQFR